MICINQVLTFHSPKVIAIKPKFANRCTTDLNRYSDH